MISDDFYAAVQTQTMGADGIDYGLKPLCQDIMVRALQYGDSLTGVTFHGGGEGCNGFLTDTSVLGHLSETDADTVGAMCLTYTCLLINQDAQTTDGGDKIRNALRLDSKNPTLDNFKTQLDSQWADISIKLLALRIGECIKDFNITEDKIHTMVTDEMANSTSLWRKIHKNDIPDRTELKALLIFLKIVFPDEYKKFKNSWTDEGKQSDIESMTAVSMSDWVGNELMSGQSLYNKINACIPGIIRRAEVTYDGWYTTGPEGAFGTPTTTQKEYTSAFRNWTASVSAKGYWNKKETLSPSAGCVTVGTMIELEDGTLKPIEKLSFPDILRNAQNTASPCSRDVIVNTEVSELYAINNDKPFMSLDHPILTQRGWCAPQPDIARENCPDIPIHQLQIGDMVLRRFNGINTYERVNRIVITENTEHTECRDLNVYDGYRSYFANGYACLITYPVLTAASLRRTLEDLPSEEQQRVLALFTDNANLWEKILPSGAYAQLIGGLTR